MKIDLVITWVNSEDKSWVEAFNKNKRIENSIDVNDDDFNGECRYRDFGLLKYWFRSIEANCSWFNKVFLILTDENQIPDWLNTDNKKLRIVYHREFIPEELLPTFNSNTIELFIPNIEDLSEKYVLFCDDMFVNRKISEDFFFVKNKPVISVVKQYSDIFVTDLYLQNMKNDYEFLKKNLNAVCRYSHNHLTVPQLKSFNKKVLNDNYNEIYNSVATSKFRNKTNLTRCIYDDNVKILNYYVDNNKYANSRLFNLRGTINTALLDNYDVICLNDNELNSNFDSVKLKLNNYFKNKYKLASSFENKSEPLVSVIIPAWNQEELIIKCLDSIPCDDRVEIIVIDDNSTDNTLNTLINYKKRKIKIYHNTENKGPGFSRNIGIENAKGDYIVMIDSDDYINTDQFKYILDNCIDLDKDIIYTLKTRINGLRWISKWSMQGDFILKSFIGDTRHNDKLSGEDTDFSNVLRAKNPKCVNIDNDWFYYYNEPRVNSLSWNKKNNVNSKEYISQFYK